MNQDVLAYVTAGLYWCLIGCWSVILVFYWREHRRLTALSPMVGTMLVVVFLDGARTLLENMYFGTWYTARTNLLPHELFETLAEPQLVLVPKLLNLLSALTIIAVLVRKWFPNLAVEMERQRRTEQFYGELQTAHTELKAAEEARDGLTDMIVHDMRTPLTNVITGLQTVQGLGLTSDLKGELVDSAIAGANRLLEMVNDLLDISKLEAGMMPIDSRPVPVAEVMDEAESLVEALAREKSLTVRREVSPAIGEGVARADRELLLRVLVNLLGNAVKFTPEGGAVTLKAARGADGMIRVAVADTGPGIPEEARARIFDKFHQLKNGGGNGGASTGLGLTFCRMAVDAQGGTIGVDSQVGAGSEFWFTLPAAETSEAAA
ncbi:MAG: HAMP domain-containing histidine kinase [Chthonomonadales bacterium]|nr:HAMP domain-containing histidine kinase [Chthonomonadales bacterium]